MTPKVEQSPQASGGNELHGLKVEHDFRILLRTHGRQQLQTQVLRHAFRMNLGGSDGDHQDSILDLAPQMLELRLSHDCESMMTAPSSLLADRTGGKLAAGFLALTRLEDCR